jgi:hypothetical protein
MSERFPKANTWIQELENAVSDAERALRSRDWEALDLANKAQPRLMHGLANALEAERIAATKEDNLAMDERIDCIVAVRAAQIDRLENFSADLRKRLIELDQFRRAAQGASLKLKQRSTFDVVR